MSTTPNRRDVITSESQGECRAAPWLGQPPIARFKASTTTTGKHPGPPTTTGGVVLTILGIVLWLAMIWFENVAESPPVHLDPPTFKPPPMPPPVVYTPPPPLFIPPGPPRPPRSRLPVFTPLPVPAVRSVVPRRPELAPPPREVSRTN